MEKLNFGSENQESVSDTTNVRLIDSGSTTKNMNKVRPQISDQGKGEMSIQELERQYYDAINPNKDSFDASQEDEMAPKNRKFAGIKDFLTNIRKKQSLIMTKTTRTLEKQSTLSQEIISNINNIGDKGNQIINKIGQNSVFRELGFKLADFDDNEIAPSQQDYKDQRATLIENYGVTMEFPAYYYYDAKFVPHLQDHLVTMAFHIIPNGNQKVQTTFQDGTVKETSFHQQYEGKSGENLIFNLYKQDGRKGLKNVRELIIENIQRAIMRFSKTGKFFAIIMKNDSQTANDDELHVFNSEDMNKCLDDIQNGKPLFKVSLNANQDGGARIMKFDINDKYIAVASRTSIKIFSLEKNTIGKAEIEFNLNEEKHEYIVDMVLDSSKGNPYECHIAAKYSSITSIQLFDIKNPSVVRTISYINKQGRIVVQISDDMKNAIFSNSHEHYILKGDFQESYPDIKRKKIWHTLSEGDNFYTVACKDYDRDIQILSTDNSKFKAKISVNLEPGMLSTYDLVKEGKYLKIVTRVGEHLFIDKVDIEKSSDDQPQSSIVDTLIERHYHSHSFNWPYYSYATKNNHVFILTAFNRNFVQRYELPSNVSAISHTFLTDSSDCFIIVETNDEHFEVYEIDLDSSHPSVSEQPVLRYPFSKVSSKTVQNFHVRSSSGKEKINLNKNLQIFVLHGDELWGWKGDQVEMISQKALNYQYVSTNQFYFQEIQSVQKGQNNKLQKSSSIKCVNSLYSMYNVKQVYYHEDKRVQLENFGVDETHDKIIILTSQRSKNKKDMVIQILDLETDKIQARILLQNKEIYNRLKTNLYQLVGGHIYYGNNVIKVRYDLLNNQQADLKDEQIFDIYTNIIKFKSTNDLVQSGTPLISTLYHRLAFLVENMKNHSTRKLLIMPYLHERKILLNRRENTDQFYTIQKYENNQFIICMCVNDHKMYVYTQNGILCERFDYEPILEQCGKPIAVSEDAKTMLFKKSNQNHEVSILNISVHGVQPVGSVNIVDRLNLHLFQLQSVKISSRKVDKKLEKTKDFTNQYKDYPKELADYWKKHLFEYQEPKKVQITYNLNDRGDILARIQPITTQIFGQSMFHNETEGLNEDDKFDSITNSSFFYYIPCEGSSNKEFIYFDSKSDIVNHMQGASINNDYIFFWNKSKIWSIELSTRNMNQLSLFLHHDSTSNIKRVRCCSDPSKIAIRVSQSQDSDQIIYWDVNKDAQTDSFDVDSKAMTFQDQQGNTFIVDGENIISSQSGYTLKCYQTKLSNYDWTNQQFNLLYGFRIDQETHNWVVFRNMINLSFSYMTFVIKEKFENSNYSSSTQQFDIEGFDYVFNRNTIFTENNGRVLKQDFKKINYLLKNFKRLDPVFLETLHYLDNQNKLPLHYALETNNTRVVNVILKYMSEINYAAAHHIQDIFSELINYQEFVGYLEELPFQTLQMESKQTLKVRITREKASESDILVCKPNESSYVDDHYYIEKMQEAPNSKNALTYATKIQCVRADWIIQGDKGEGKKFLIELYRQKNKNIMVTPYIKIIIEFLYKEYSRKIMMLTMPPFIIHLISVYVLVYLSELERDNDELVKTLNVEKKAVIDHNEHRHNLKQITFFKNTVQYIAFIFNIINFIIFAIQSYNLKLTQFYRPWAYLDFIQLGANFVVSSSLFRKDFDVIQLRKYEALLMIMMTYKTLYFLRLVGEIAPLIDIIFSIVRDIRWFVMIFLISEFSFMCSFYSLGKNQKDLALKKGDPTAVPSYSTYRGALMHVYESVIGGYSTDDYRDNEMTPLLFTLFILMTFTMTIHLLNMLIAIMGESFSTNKDNKEADKKISQLGFIIDNWQIDAVQNKEKIVYLIAAYKVEDQNDLEEERINQFERRIEELTQSQEVMAQEIREMNQTIQLLALQK